jgi:hypothetical protein
MSGKRTREKCRRCFRALVAVARRAPGHVWRDFPRVRLSLIGYQPAIGPSPCSLLRPNFQQGVLTLTKSAVFGSGSFHRNLHIDGNR